ncbi:MAG TPA: cytochrome c biogenesis protein CcsA [Chitinophagaceae bacterium]|nr:cytochrome c biogenesis protein CcsA [Chitinophagaceae bacterium]
MLITLSASFFIKSFSKSMRTIWWKVACAVLLIYTCIQGFLVDLPPQVAYINSNLYESMRNFFFHVPMWFSQCVLITVSLVYSIRYLRNPKSEFDLYAQTFAKTGTVMGSLGLVTGAIWANYTWGSPWNNDPKQLGAAIALLIYLAYFILRNSMPDIDKRNRIAAVYNIFAYFIYIPMIFILPRLVESLHPGGKGSEGNPAMGGSSLTPSMEAVFWPAVLGWTLLGVWISTLYFRIQLIEDKKINS